MADKATISIGATLKVAGYRNLSLNAEVYSWVPTNGKFYWNIHNIGTDEEEVDSFGDTVPSDVIVINRSATNYVQVGRTTTEYYARLRPGKAMAIAFEPGTSLFMKANTAACDVEIIALPL